MLDFANPVLWLLYITFLPRQPDTPTKGKGIFMSEVNKSAKFAADKNKKGKRKGNPIKRTLTVIGTTILSLVLIVIITGSIVATALTVYVMKFMDDTSEIDLYNLDLNTTSIIYAYDNEGKEVELQRVSKDENRIIVEANEVPEHVKMAFVCVEDERFFEHQGVDFKRTFSAFVNMFLHFSDSRYGGSTITQQLVKNVTGDDDDDIGRKIREIFTAMKLEDKYTKPDILEAYLNYIGFGGNTYGVQAASYKYFGKDVSQITVAEAASLAAIPKSPTAFNPLKYPEKNKARQKIVLDLMLENSVISDEEYDEAVNQPLVFANQNADGTEAGTNQKVQSYFVDMVEYEVAEDLMELYGLDSVEDGLDKIANSGYRIYSTVNMDMQNYVEQKFLDYKTFSKDVLNDPPQAAFICMDYRGNIKAVVGGIGEKPTALSLNRATMSKRSPGSCIKPISTYSYGLSLDMFHWSSLYTDSPIEVKDYTDGAEKLIQWPKNYSNKWTYQNYFIYDALRRSLNTVPAQLCRAETPLSVFNFVREKMGITTLVDSMVVEGRTVSDIDLSPMTVGGLTQGITLKELVAAYQPFGNLGKRYEPTSYSKVTDSDGNIILEHQYLPFQALDQETAYVMNRLMLNVTAMDGSTGVQARLQTTPVAAKTGTSQDWMDLSFVGCTPDYVSGIWYGYDKPTIYNEKTKKWEPHSAFETYYSSAKVWKNVFGEIAESEAGKAFPVSDTVKELYYCTVTGLLAGPNCTTRSAMPGFYKSSNIPQTCDGTHTGVYTNTPATGTTTGTETTMAGETTSTAPVTTTTPAPTTTTPFVTIPSVNEQH